MTHQISIVDSHTAGQPTRVIVDGGPNLGSGSMWERRERFQNDFDHFRTALVDEPRGSGVTVGALLCPPADPSAAMGVIFFNNAGYLGMCGHGLIGVVRTLLDSGHIDVGQHTFETPIGPVQTWLEDDHSVSFENVPSYRQAKGMAIEVPGLGRVVGDIAWGGNRFFLVSDPVDLQRTPLTELITRTTSIRDALIEAGHSDVDHVELFGAPRNLNSHSRNFVLCPGGHYDRSPCGTGTSAKLACLAADNRLSPGEMWIQEGISGITFTGRYRWHHQEEGSIVARIQGTAHLSSYSKLVMDPADPFCWGMPVSD